MNSKDHNESPTEVAVYRRPEHMNAPRSSESPQVVGRIEKGRKPNIVFIVADDMGYGDFSAFNFGASQTPAIDRLMREGTVLTQHYAGSAVCTPSRACLMTGRYPQRTGAVDTLDVSGLNNLGLEEATIADLLGAGGYVTGIVGKWHLGWADPRHRPHARGFQEAIALEKCGHWDWVLDYNGVRKEADGRYEADVLSEEAVHFMRRHRQEPFFLYLTFFEPHDPLEAPEEDIRPFLEAGISENVSKIYGMIRRMDHGIDRVLNELKRLGLEDDTLVVVTSDNGPQPGPSWTDRSSTTRYNCGFNGHKDLVYEGGIRIPAIVRWPAGFPRLGMINDMTHFSDWFPTLLDLAGVGVPSGLRLDGQSMVTLLRGEPYVVAPRRFWQFSRYFPTPLHNAAVREGDWKLVRPCLDDVTGPLLGVLAPHHGIAQPTCDWNGVGRYRPRLPEPLTPQLFNLLEDPQELNDLSAQHPHRMERMGRELDNWFESVITGCLTVA
jgi:arylsulfatase A